MRHRANCRRRTTNAAVTVTVTVRSHEWSAGGCWCFRETQFYALSDFAVGGRCKCNGHASRCIAKPDARRAVRDGRSRSAEVDLDSSWRGRYSVGLGAASLTCDCRHNTEGLDCERCRAFYHDRPWARATASNAHPCVGLSIFQRSAYGGSLCTRFCLSVWLM